MFTAELRLSIKGLQWTLRGVHELKTMKATSSKRIFLLEPFPHSLFMYGVYFQPGAFICRCSCEIVIWWRRATLHRLVLFAPGLDSSRAQRLREPVPGPDWQRFWLHWHTRPTRHHQLPAGSAVQVQLQLPFGIPGQQHPAGLVSLTCLFDFWRLGRTPCGCVKKPRLVRKRWCKWDKMKCLDIKWYSIK